MPADIRQLPREEFIEKNLGLVHACAGRFKGRGIEYEELYAAGCLGLVKACDGFDTGRGVCFFHLRRTGNSGREKAVPGRRHSQGKPLTQGAVAEDQSRAGALSKSVPGRSRASQNWQKPWARPGADRPRHPGSAAGPEPDAADDEDGLKEFDVPIDSPEEALSDRIGLAEVMDRLSDGDRQLIRLRFFGGRTQSETARVLGTTQVQISAASAAF